MNEDLRARYLDGDELDADERALLADEVGLLERLRSQLADPQLWDEPPAGLEDDVVAAVRAAAAAGPIAPAALAATDRPVDAAAGGPAGSGAVVIPLATARRRTWLAAVGSAAAAALLAAGITAAVRGGDRGGGPAVAQNQVELALPDGRPGSLTVADTASGLRIHLDAPDLVRLPAGQFYQGWLKSADGSRLVTIGTFHAGNDVTLWAGVSLEDFTTLTVTIEPDDGNPASSGNKVLAVPLRSS